MWLPVWLLPLLLLQRQFRHWLAVRSGSVPGDGDGVIFNRSVILSIVYSIQSIQKSISVPSSSFVSIPIPIPSFVLLPPLFTFEKPFLSRVRKPYSLSRFSVFHCQKNRFSLKVLGKSLGKSQESPPFLNRFSNNAPFFKIVKNRHFWGFQNRCKH